MTLASTYNRNGTSQSQRYINALDADYFLLEERSIADLIVFAKKYAEILRYYNDDDQLEGNWTDFLDGDPGEMADFLKDPASFDSFPEKKEKYSRPHLVLFIVFLKLLQQSHGLLNGLTKKQLDFYYRTALGFSPKKAVADQVHVLAKVNTDRAQILIPKGTILEAGADGQGNPVQYVTNDDLVASHARIARLMSLYVEKKVTDIQLLRFQEKAEVDRGLLSILSLTYRKPGTANSPRNFPANLKEDKPFDKALIAQLDALEKTITGTFHLRIAGFQRLMQDYHYWENENTWLTINNFLLATSNKKNNTNQGLDIFADPYDFDTNFEKVLGFKVNGLKKDKTNVFDGIPDVNNLYDLFDNLIRTPDDPVINNFISNQFLQAVPAFQNFINTRNQNRGFLKNIQQYLKATAKKNGIAAELWSEIPYKKEKTLSLAFANYLGANTVKNDRQLADYESSLNNLQTYFRMKAEDYFFIRNLYLPANFSNVPNWKWEKADSLLIQAHQDLFKTANVGSGLPVPEIISWKTMYEATDATRLLVTSVADGEPYPRWKTFGGLPTKGSDAKFHFAADIGWGISSPALALSEGVRQLTLNFSFRINEFDAQRDTLKQYLRNWNAGTPKKGPYPFRIEVSTAKGWITLSDWQAFGIDARKPVMQIVILAKEDVDPFAPVADSPADTGWPWLRLILSREDLIYTDVNGKETGKQIYELFRGQSLESLQLDISVSGLKKLQIQTKEGTVDPKKPFDIFGAVPQLGDRVFITHPELVTQKLDSLTMNLEWKNLPKDGLTKYYDEYSKSGEVATVKNENFKVKLSLNEGYRRMVLTSGQFGLFPAPPATSQILNATDIPEKFPESGETYNRKLNAVNNPDVIRSERYLEMELDPQDFLHNKYTGILQKLANDSVRNSYKEGKYIPAPPPVLPEPFTPTVKSITIDYKTSITVDWKSGNNFMADTVAHIEPFGFFPLLFNGEAVPFFPDFEKEGTLYIGMDNVDFSQNISFLFQLAEGSADPDLEPAAVTWSYLTENDWMPFRKEDLLLDSTGGFLSSGLIQMHIPADAGLNHQRMPDGLYWLKAEVDRYTGSLSDCIDIRTQAVSATWIDTGNLSNHLLGPLNAGSIKQPVEPVPGLLSLSQPYSSFFGKAAEADEQLYRRASARLRHKDRALTMWDYENMVLEQFPDIFKAKAISADLWGESYEPGIVRIIVIPDIRLRKPFDPFEPRVPVMRLREIQQFLQERAPACTDIRVQNPRFWYLQLRVAVRFYDMNNFGLYAGKLHQQLLEYLAPWAFDKSVDIMFGRKVYPSVLVDFIEDLPYVDYIDKPGMALMSREEDGVVRVIRKPILDAEGLFNVDEPDVVVVSAHQHYIEYLSITQDTNRQIRQGIGFAKIEYDFRIN